MLQSQELVESASLPSLDSSPTSASTPASPSSPSSWSPLFTPTSSTPPSSASPHPHPSSFSSSSSSSPSSSTLSSSFPTLAKTCGSYATLPLPPFPCRLSSLCAFLTLESSFPHPFDYTSHLQLELTLDDRAVLLSYLHSSGLLYGLSSQCVALSVCVLERFLQLRSVKRPFLQLAALTALLVAMKVVESSHPSMSALSAYTLHLYSPAMIREMELLLLASLTYRLSDTSALAALDHTLTAFHTSLPTPIQHTAHHLLQTAYANNAFIACRGSLVALAAIVAAWRWHGRGGEGDVWLVQQWGRWIGGGEEEGGGEGKGEGGEGWVMDMGLVGRVAQLVTDIGKREGEQVMTGNDSDEAEEEEEQEGEGEERAGNGGGEAGAEQGGVEVEGQEEEREALDRTEEDGLEGKAKRRRLMYHH